MPIQTGHAEDGEAGKIGRGHREEFDKPQFIGDI